MSKIVRAQASSISTSPKQTLAQQQQALRAQVAAALGHWAEQQAAQQLLLHGWRIEQRNYHSRYGEIDLIATQGEHLVMLEVKARSLGSLARAHEVVSAQKQQRLIKTSLIFLQQHLQFEHYAVRFDVMCFDFYEKIAKTIQQDFSQYRYDVNWIENAFTLDFDCFRLNQDWW